MGMAAMLPSGMRIEPPQNGMEAIVMARAAFHRPGVGIVWVYMMTCDETVAGASGLAEKRINQTLLARKR